MNRYIAGLIATIAAVALAAPAGAQKSSEADTMLAAAQQKETLEGDPSAAIKQYSAIVSKYAKTDRAVTAMALVHMAECYQKIGDAQAQKIYEQVVREYSDQKDAVAVARAGLGRTGLAHATGIVARQVWAGPKVDIMGGVSPDGRYLTFLDWDTGNLELHDVSTGKDRNLTRKGTWNDSGDYAEGSIISPDGKRAAYSWFNSKTYVYELRLISLLDDSAAPRVLFSNKDVHYIVLSDWSTDGRWIAVELLRADLTAQIALVNAENGSLRILKSTDWTGVNKICFSPDTRYVAYDLQVGDPPQRDIFIMTTDGSRESPVVVNPGNDVPLGWMPDGKTLLFSSDRSGQPGLWGQHVNEGRPEGGSELLKTDIGSARSVGLGRSGTLYTGEEVALPNIFVASVDFTKGTVDASPVQAVSSYIGRNKQPVWSADGRYLAYKAYRGTGEVLGIQSFETGATRDVPVKLATFNYPQWSIDGNSFLVQGKDFKGRQGIYRISQTGDATLVVQHAYAPKPLPDGTNIVYAKQEVNTKGGSIVERELGSGKEHEILRMNDDDGMNMYFCAVSPDGHSIAGAWLDMAAKETRLVLLPLAGGDSRVLFRSPGSNPIREVTWTADGGSIVFQKELSASSGQFEWWVIPVNGGEPRKLPFTSRLINDLHPHPDGRHVLFMDGAAKDEIWAFENLQPALSAKK